MASDATKDWVWKAIASGSLKAWAYHATITYIIPIGTPLVAAWLGYVQGLPWMYIFVGALVTFAAISTSLLRFEEWRFRRAVKDKLALHTPIIGCRRAAPGVGPALGLKLGFNLASQADFPVEFEVAKLRTTVGVLHNPKPSYDTRNIVIPGRGQAFFHDDFIAIEMPIVARNVDCIIEADIFYGRVGRLQYEISKKWIVHVKFDDEGVPLPAQWSEAA